MRYFERVCPTFINQYRGMQLSRFNIMRQVRLGQLSLHHLSLCLSFSRSFSAFATLVLLLVTSLPYIANAALGQNFSTTIVHPQIHPVPTNFHKAQFAKKHVSLMAFLTSRKKNLLFLHLTVQKLRNSFKITENRHYINYFLFLFFNFSKKNISTLCFNPKKAKPTILTSF